MNFSRLRGRLAFAAGLVLALSLTGCAPTSPTPPSPSPPVSAPSVPEQAALTLADLPEARFDAVIPALLGVHFETPSVIKDPRIVTLSSPLTLYGYDEGTQLLPVAYLAATDFTGAPTATLAFDSEHPGYSMILTPSRQILPSQSADAPAQTAGYVKTSDLPRGKSVSQHITVNLGKGTVSVIDAMGFPVWETKMRAGASSTPTPTGLGYVEAVYSDPTQSPRPILLTSLHAVGADEPYSSGPRPGLGGLIAIHAAPLADSHGCIRVTPEAQDQLLKYATAGMPVVVLP